MKKDIKRMVGFVLLLAAGLLWWGKPQTKNCLAAFVPAAPKGVLAVGVKDKIVLSWERVRGADGYEIYEKEEEQGSWSQIKVTAAKKVVLNNRIRGQKYFYKIRAYKAKRSGIIYGSFSKKSDTILPEKGTSTIRNLLKTAIAPVGSTMYIWGGGWNKQDNGAGKDALRIGLNPKWREFAQKQKASYQYKKYRYKRGYGLDCSGFVGWTVFNAFHYTKGKSGEGYVTKSKTMAADFARKGWGSYKKASAVRNYKAGDIMSGPGHVYIVVGQCRDKSVVLVHSSPAGVQISGTVTPSGKKNSQAVKLARQYMKKYYPSWYRRYSDCSRGISYLKQYHQFRWDIGDDSKMQDAEGYQKKSAKEVLKDLFD